MTEPAGDTLRRGRGISDWQEVVNVLALDAVYLAEFEGYRFRVSAHGTFKSPMFVTGLVDRLDAKKHWQPAVRASPLADRRLC